MTIVCLPIDASGGTPAYTAQQFRQAVTGLMYGGLTGPLAAQSGAFLGHAPTLSTTTTTASIGGGCFVVSPGFTTTQSAYLVSSDATTSVGIAAASATTARTDYIDLQVSDTAIDSSGARSAQFVYVQGSNTTGAGGPLTARSYRAIVINVPISGGGSPTIALNPQFAVASGGILPVANATQRDALITAPASGMACYLQDVATVQIYNGTSWLSASAVRGGRQFIGTRAGTSDAFSSGSVVTLLTATLPSTAPAGAYIVTSILDITSTVTTSGNLRILDPSSTNLSADKTINPILTATRNIIPWTGGFTWAGGAGTVVTQISIASGTGTVFNPGANICVTYIGA